MQKLKQQVFEALLVASVALIAVSVELEFLWPLTYALMPSLYCEAEFCIKCLNTVIYILFIGYSVLM